jgi:hypothetical protein
VAVRGFRLSEASAAPLLVVPVGREDGANSHHHSLRRYHHRD